ncbi:MAG: biotin transporter BioY [Rhodobacterales bacterium]|nr:biotin transporter BioY [Rhodobacterales bacterium]
MALSMTDNKVLVEATGLSEGAARLFKQAVLVVVGIALLTLAAKIKVPMWPSPVPVTMGTFAILTIGAAYGPRLGLITVLGYMLIGALGFDVFAGSSAEKYGLAYMTGGTGGYLLGYVLATLFLGWAARRGWDRSVLWMALALLIGNVIIYVPGVAWIYHIILAGAFDPAKYGSVWEQTMVWGLTPYLIGDAMKLALAALLLPGLWKLIGNARA